MNGVAGWAETLRVRVSRLTACVCAYRYFVSLCDPTMKYWGISIDSDGHGSQAKISVNFPMVTGRGRPVRIPSVALRSVTL